jgi:hypothetical protein
VTGVLDGTVQGLQQGLAVPSGVMQTHRRTMDGQGQVVAVIATDPAGLVLGLQPGRGLPQDLRQPPDQDVLCHAPRRASASGGI